MSEAERPASVSDPVRAVERFHGGLVPDGVRRLPIRDQRDRQACRYKEKAKE